MNVKIRAVLLIFKYLKLFIFCSFLAILFKIFLSLMRIIKRGSANSLRFLVASLMCSGGGTCSKYTLSVEDEESFTSREIYYKDNSQQSVDGDNNMEDTEIILDSLSPHVKDSQQHYNIPYHSEETGRTFRCRSQQGQSDIRKLTLAGAMKLDDEQQQLLYQQPHFVVCPKSTTSAAGEIEAQL
ncbi:unnamed protein product [Orchesella dallaii]|uniref:Uncharacterized protein n=1 Tax=Orchesella dallaii TaxID=48710 RepID=A0ABP1QWN5_9HEXA